MEKDKLIHKVCQDTSDIFTRLFDHRPFLNGEVQHFVREFEGKKNIKDIGLLLKSCEKLTDINDLLNTSVGDNTKEVISSLLDNISKTTTSLEAVSSPKPLNENKYLLDKEALRQKKKEEFFENYRERLLSLDNLVKEKELELRNHYQQLEENLKTTL
ncbi:biogenesis of lysosome-related organelles complex 1 subunit 5-like [Daphnia carinata]|uniref:biogenesis of lysosome-related organelles complex 1 subunit 5-like n=1 Tax=Daphnia carinata TaxID=120202 RepID=UPI002868626F|nr:biogenesis of lysosome-related organelles complex 1 subunit 5-like [Daphnia carinata]